MNKPPHTHHRRTPTPVQLQSPPPPPENDPRPHGVDAAAVGGPLERQGLGQVLYARPRRALGTIDRTPKPTRGRADFRTRAKHGQKTQASALGHAKEREGEKEEGAWVLTVPSKKGHLKKQTMLEWTNGAHRVRHACEAILHVACYADDAAARQALPGRFELFG